MNEDLERRLDGFYREFDGAARRLEARWRRPPARWSVPPALWIGAATAAAALLLVTLLPRGIEEPRRPAPPTVAKPPEETAPPAPPAPRSQEEPKPPAVPPGMPPEKAPAPPPATAPSRPPESLPEPAPPNETPPPPPKPTVAEVASVVFPETEGSFDLSNRPLRGRQKDLRVHAGDTLRAAGPVKLSLAPQRFVLAAPQTVLRFTPEEKRLTLELEQGKLLLELVEAGLDVRVTTRAAEIRPIGTVFAVQAEGHRTSVLVEEGRVEVRGPRGNATLRAGQAIQAEDDALGAAAPADFRALAWARALRPPDRTLLSEDFSAAGRWEAEVRDGAARGLPVEGAAGRIHLESPGPPLFEVPVRGQATLVYRTDRVGKLYVQFFASDLRVNFRREVPVLRSPQWKTLILDLEEFAPVDRSKHPGRLPPGTPIVDIIVAFETDLEKGSLWVDSFRVAGLRP